MSTKSEKNEKENKERKKAQDGIGSPTASAKRPLSPGAATFMATTIDAPMEPPVPEFRPPVPVQAPRPVSRSESTVFAPAFDLPERTSTPRRYSQEDIDDFNSVEFTIEEYERQRPEGTHAVEDLDDFASVPAPDEPLKKGGGYMYPAIKNYMKRYKRKSNMKSKKNSKKKSKKKSKRKSKKNSKKKSKKKSKKARRRL